MEKLEGNLATVEKELADPELYNDDEKAAKVQDKYQSVKGQLDQKNAEWEELVDEISKLQETLS